MLDPHDIDASIAERLRRHGIVFEFTSPEPYTGWCIWSDAATGEPISRCHRTNSASVAVEFLRWCVEVDALALAERLKPAAIAVLARARGGRIALGPSHRDRCVADDLVLERALRPIGCRPNGSATYEITEFGRVAGALAQRCGNDEAAPGQRDGSGGATW